MLSRAGIINVYQYGDETLDFGGGGCSASSACCRTRRGTHAARQELRRIRDLPCGLREARPHLAASLGARARWRGVGAR
jgi:hypothetical protein